MRQKATRGVYYLVGAFFAFCLTRGRFLQTLTRFGRYCAFTPGRAFTSVVTVVVMLKGQKEMFKVLDF